MPGSKDKASPSLKLFDESQIEVVRKGMLAARETIAVAESVTAGLLQLALASAEEASQFFQGGITAYNVGQKTLQLNVEPIQALATNCVSEQVACEMALHVCVRFRSHWGVGVTGFAVPVPESDNKVYAWHAIAHQGKVIHSERISGQHQPTLQVQSSFVDAILARLASIVTRKKG